MPKMTKRGTPRRDELPSTVRRSGQRAQRTFAKVHDSAAQQYGEGEIAHRTAYSALKHTHEKVGSRWVPKNGKGPSDRQAERGGAGRPRYQTAGGVDANASKRHLYEVARKLDVPGRSTMNKSQLVKAIQRENAARTRKARAS